MASSDSSGEEDTVLYSTINFIQPPSQPPGNNEESIQNEVELNHLYYTVITKPAISSDSRSVYSQLKVRWKNTTLRAAVLMQAKIDAS